MKRVKQNHLKPNYICLASIFSYFKGRDVAASPLLNVEWPSIALVNVPTHLETYSNNVEITAKFTTNLCSQMLVAPTKEHEEEEEEISRLSRDSSKRGLRKLPFETYFELISCPERKLGYYNQITSECQVNIFVFLTKNILIIFEKFLTFDLY